MDRWNPMASYPSSHFIHDLEGMGKVSTNLKLCMVDIVGCLFNKQTQIKLDGINRLTHKIHVHPMYYFISLGKRWYFMDLF